MKRYNPKDIEPKWQKMWDKERLYEASEDPSRPKKYVLEYFPYPSGAAMHVGHVRNYTIGDVVARHARMSGFNVLHPMGWDAFGLPAENYAIKNNISPQKAIQENTGKFKKQLMQIGFSYDWSREINSSDPKYYKWTQWFFKLLYERGLAYQKESLQWWCDFDKTVLANEQVEAGKCWRCGNPVTKKALKQWFFKITDYADRLSEDLDTLDWSEAIKAMQRNWIGRSKGASIKFQVKSKKESSVEVFTTRPDTIFGVTFMVLAPEHPLVEQITTDEHRQHVMNYVKAAEAKTDVERQETDREKTGVFTGAYAINPANDQKIPIWVADYVLYGYGTGAIMAVPAHDERDHAFAVKFDLPIRHVIAPTFGEPHKDEVSKKSIIVALRNPKTDEVLVLNWGPRQVNYGGMMLIGGTREGNEDPEATAHREITEETGYTNVRLVAKSDVPGYGHFYSNTKKVHVGMEATGLYYELVDEIRSSKRLDEGEKDKFTIDWHDPSKVASLLDDGIHEYYYRTLVLGEVMHDDGILINSGQYDGLTSAEGRRKIVEDLEHKGLGKAVTNYKIRDWLISRQRYWGAPIPVIYCDKDGVVLVPDEDLPVKLPEVKSYAPTGEGTSVLASVEGWVNVKCPKCGGPARREIDTMDGFACSSWYFLRFADPHNDREPFSQDKVKFWLPVDDYIGGAEHAVMHLLYARMWTKVMFDTGLIDFDEPFLALRNQGMILAPDGRKMSKSWGNTITPDEIIEQGYGADSIRIMELFIGPWDQSANWSVEGLGGCYRFLQRVWTLVQEYLDKQVESEKSKVGSDELLRAINKAVKKVSDDVAGMGFNTAIASLMELVNELYKIKAAGGFAAPQWRETLEKLLLVLAPFAPHMTEELWHQLGHDESIHKSDWPKYDEKYLASKTITIAVQVNGKLRATLELSADITEEAAVEAAKNDSNVSVYLTGKQIVKTIFVPGKIVNLVVKTS